jgi:hypothetical protein
MRPNIIQAVWPWFLNVQVQFKVSFQFMKNLSWKNWSYVTFPLEFILFFSVIIITSILKSTHVPPLSVNYAGP